MRTLKMLLLGSLLLSTAAVARVDTIVNASDYNMMVTYGDTSNYHGGALDNIKSVDINSKDTLTIPGFNYYAGNYPQIRVLSVMVKGDTNFTTNYYFKDKKIYYCSGADLQYNSSVIVLDVIKQLPVVSCNTTMYVENMN